MTTQNYEIQYHINNNIYRYDCRGDLADHTSRLDHEAPESFTNIEAMQSDLLQRLSSQEFWPQHSCASGVAIALVTVYDEDEESEGPAVEFKFNIDENAKAVNIQEVAR